MAGGKYFSETVNSSVAEDTNPGIPGMMDRAAGIIPGSVFGSRILLDLFRLPSSDCSSSWPRASIAFVSEISRLATETTFKMMKTFKKILVVVKQTPYESYLQLKAQGKAPVALRWERLKDRYQTHRQCVDTVTGILQSVGADYIVVGREELHRGIIEDKDLIITVGGDGTMLNASSFIDDSIPVLGVNSDPTKPEETTVANLKDERRSRGALCAATANNVHAVLPRILYGNYTPGHRSRIKCLVRSTHTETRLAPALNDILVAHPSPAAVSRFRLMLCKGTVKPSTTVITTYQPDEIFSFNVWSSGIWISTATGSTAAIYAAGGKIMDVRSESLQYMVREHLLEDRSPASLMSNDGRGFINTDEQLIMRWNSQVGYVFVDGSHNTYKLELGDEIKIDGHAPILQVFDPLPESDLR